MGYRFVPLLLLAGFAGVWELLWPEVAMQENKIYTSHATTPLSTPLLPLLPASVDLYRSCRFYLPLELTNKSISIH